MNEQHANDVAQDVAQEEAMEVDHARQQTMMSPPDDSGILDETIESTLNTTPLNSAPGCSRNVIQK